jgi:acid phosphatase class B
MKEAVISDIDSTLSDLNGRNPYDMWHVKNDLVKKHIKAILDRFKHEGKTIIFLTGRTEEAREDTVEWLEKIGFKNPILFMREKGDKRPSEVYKKSVYDKEIKGKYNVVFALDDKTENVEMFRRLGIRTLNV